MIERNDSGSFAPIGQLWVPKFLPLRPLWVLLRDGVGDEYLPLHLLPFEKKPFGPLKSVLGFDPDTSGSAIRPSEVMLFSAGNV